MFSFSPEPINPDDRREIARDELRREYEQVFVPEEDYPFEEELPTSEPEEPDRDESLDGGVWDIFTPWFGE